MNASSTCALSVPVWRHWSTNFVFDRLVMIRIVKIETRDGDGGDDREQRRDRDHHDEDADDRQRRREQLAHRLLQALGEVVDVVGDPAQHVAARLTVDVAQRHAVELVLDVGAQLEHRPLHDAGEQVRLQVATTWRTPRRCRARSSRRVCSVGEVDALPARDAAHDDVGGAAEDLGREHQQRDAGDGEDQDGDDAEPLRAQPGREPAGRVLEVLRPFQRHARGARSDHRTRRGPPRRVAGRPSRSSARPVSRLACAVGVLGGLMPPPPR